MKRNIKNSTTLPIFLVLCSFFLFYGGEANADSVTARTKISGYGGFSGYNPLKSKGLLAIISASSDGSNGIATESADAAIFGADSSWDTKVWLHSEGLSIEPMAFAAAETVYKTNQNYEASAFASAGITIRHQIRAAADTPPSILNLAIPMFLHYSLDASGGPNVKGVVTSANFSALGYGVNFGKSVANGESDSGIFSFNSTILNYIDISASAGVNATWYSGVGGFTGASGTAVSDPFLQVDPGWEHAQYFSVVQQSLLNPGEWVEVTRMWKNPTPDAIPEPATVLLLGSGLIGLLGFRRKMHC